MIYYTNVNTPYVHYQ